MAIIAGALMLSAPAPAQVSASPSAQTVPNWDIFLKLYPRRALAAKEEGQVGFTVKLNNKGDVVDCQVTHSSGHPLLDEETCRLITLNAVFKPDPALSPSQTKTHEGVINWRLPASLAVPAPPQPVAAEKTPEKIVCKKSVRTGTLAGFERVCMTPTEWARQADNMKDAWQEMQGKKGMTAGRN